MVLSLLSLVLLFGQIPAALPGEVSSWLDRFSVFVWLVLLADKFISLSVSYLLWVQG